MIFLYQSVCPRPDAIIATTGTVLWSPIKVGDIRWNFEKFLFDHTGKPFKRYNEVYLPLLMDSDVKQLIGNCMKARRQNSLNKHTDYYDEEDEDMVDEA